MFAQVLKASAASADEDAARLREIDVAGENQHDHSAFISRFLATHAYTTITAFIAQLNSSCTGIPISAVASSPQPPSVSRLLSLLSRVDAVIDAHPPVPPSSSFASRFGNPAFRAVLQDINAQSAAWLTETLRGAVELSQLPLVKRGREKLQVNAEDGEDSGHPHVHLPPHVPQKVLDSLRARGELPPENQHGPQSHPQHQPEESRAQQEAETEQEDEGCVSDDERLSRVVDCLSLYLCSSFGDERRIDYGTGHELHFVCFLYALSAVGFIPLPPLSPQPLLPPSGSAELPAASPSIFTSLSLVVFPRYLRVMRRLQSLYLLEPAGSRGCWGLDDYSFLPFLLGSSQLCSHPHLRPRSVRYAEVLETQSDDWLYLDAVRWLMSVKGSVSFAEHSPVLYDVTSVRSWQQVNAGLRRMYEAEVMRKQPIVQHFIFTALLSSRLVREVTPVQVREADLCCSDSIHFPSALASRHPLTSD